MRILMVSDVYFPRVNGVSTSIATYRDSLRALGHEVTLIAPAYPAGRADEDWVRRVPSRGVWLDPEDRMMRWGALMSLTDGLRRERFDLVHIQTPFVAHYAGLRLARRLGIPAIESYHTYFEEYLSCYLPLAPRPLTRAWARMFSRSQGNAVDAVVTPSRAMHDKLADYGVTTPIGIIPTGLDLPRFTGGDRQRFRRKLGIPEDRPLLLYVGRVAHEKNIDFLLETLTEIRRVEPRALLLVAGEGPAETHLHHLCTRLGIGENVLFTGYLDRAGSLLDCYAAADVFVFASHTETQGLVLLEAMAMGLPVVAHAVMGAREVLREGEGALVAAPGDRADFAAQVLRLLGDPSLLHEQRQRAREYAARWSNEACAQRMVELYQETVLRREEERARRYDRSGSAAH